MTTLPIIIAPDPRLNEVAETVKAVDDHIRKIVEDLFETMYANSGAGLAATQVGINKRILVICLPSSMDETEPKYAVINPEITYLSEEQWTVQEGCLSFPIEERFEITRPAHIKVKFLDQNGLQHEVSSSGWLARAFQHEIDHLNGVTMVHYVSKIKRDMILKKLIKYKKEMRL